jgi:hypothetical protein
MCKKKRYYTDQKHTSSVQKIYTILVKCTVQQFYSFFNSILFTVCHGAHTHFTDHQIRVAKFDVIHTILQAWDLFIPYNRFSGGHRGKSSTGTVNDSLKEDMLDKKWSESTLGCRTNKDLYRYSRYQTHLASDARKIPINDAIVLRSCIFFPTLDGTRTTRKTKISVVVPGTAEFNRSLPFANSQRVVA